VKLLPDGRPIDTVRGVALNKLWLWIAGAALLPLAAGASTKVPTSIVQNGAPISIDQCSAVLANTAGGNAGASLSEYVNFTNVSQRTAIEVRFALEIVDSTGVTKRTLTADEPGTFVPGIPTNQLKPLRADPDDAQQAIGVMADARKIVCSVRMVRFDDGSVWHEGDGPAGSAVIYTPLPGPSPTPEWHFPENWATP
jgi:hypothetical protein